jgi:hypothetical protein
MKRLWLLVVAMVTALAVYYYATWQHWLAFATGSYNTQGVAHNYNFFSGAGSDIGEITIATSLFASAFVLWRANTCHRYWWCWHHGHFLLEGTPYKLCAKHHPDDVPTRKEAMAAMKETSDGT